ncbi:hypothetical protein KAFR_0I01730 [Kazachstania africana CBS 2517]|uniref:Uncharacterized protein n=1 Tax=Kazachstania africana (strain ATCC 22294 / BCRC 22015 / CBS 2517 / CECT 1963 / NBRC 1671 / NRRL Y-8276) TaxID=1071382 RepID=H2B004_KAZAF|nr:hypothetical protein KAFR_0I01730 [Kazachstania africana CBS 2517]CCF59954.1 hypothetical protein KAFR_0I01730 [Kazachstania africana CBS 2517]
MLSGIFLAKFDMKKGNVIEWQQDCQDFPNLEFKSLPSGIHEQDDDVVNFTVFKDPNTYENGLLQGVAYFKQNSFDTLDDSGQVDRSKILMYSLGILTEDTLLDEQYTSALEKLLSDWLAAGELHSFDTFIQYYKEQKTGGITRRSMTEYVPYWMEQLGPLIFPIWKSCLLNEKILVLIPFGCSFETCSALCYFLHLVSNSSSVQETQLLFTIGTFDVDSMLKGTCGYIACTSDEILTLNDKLYDKLIKIPGDVENATVQFLTNTNELIKGTPHELELFQISEKKGISDLSEPLTWSQFFMDSFYFLGTIGFIKPPYHNHIAVIDQVSIQPVLSYFKKRTQILHDILQTIASEGSTTLSPMELNMMDLDCFSKQDYEFIEKISSKWFNKTIHVTTNMKSFC